MSAPTAQAVRRPKVGLVQGKKRLRQHRAREIAGSGKLFASVYPPSSAVTSGPWVGWRAAPPPPEVIFRRRPAEDHFGRRRGRSPPDPRARSHGARRGIHTRKELSRSGDFARSVLAQSFLSLDQSHLRPPDRLGRRR